MATTFNKLWIPVTKVLRPGQKLARNEKRKNVTVHIPVFSYAFPATDPLASLILAVLTVPITTTWTIRMQDLSRPGNFGLTVTWSTGGVRYRYIVFHPPNAPLAYNDYLGEAIPPGAALEIWSGSTSPAVLASAYELVLGLLEAPTNPSDVTGTAVDPSICVVPFTPYVSLEELFGRCPLPT